MTLRRAFYTEGSGLLVVSTTRLLFLTTADHPSVPALLSASREKRPLRSLAAAIIAEGFAVPPFTFLEYDAHIQGLAVGSLEVQVNDPHLVTIDGSAADPWAQIHAPMNATVSSGDDVADLLWLESGVVRAAGFRWVPVTDQATPPAPTQRPREVVQARSGPARETPPAQPQEVETSDTEELSPALDEHDAGTVTIPPEEDSPLAEILEAEPDLTIDAIQMAAVHEETERGGSIRRLPPAGAAALQPTPTQEDTPEATPTGGTPTGGETTSIEPEESDADRTISLRPGEVLLDQPPPPGTVKALVCLACQHPNPPATGHCGGCDQTLADPHSETRYVPQPALGVIQLSDGRTETLDADLLIGRNPARGPLGAHQRAVVHSEGDRSISRRHIEVRRDGWNALVTNLKEGDTTVVESTGGHITPLKANAARRLEPGDTVRYGRAWFRFEPEASTSPDSD